MHTIYYKYQINQFVAIHNNDSDVIQYGTIRQVTESVTPTPTPSVTPSPSPEVIDEGVWVVVEVIP